LAKKENTDGYSKKTTHTLEAAFFYAGKILSLVTTKQGVAGLIQRIFTGKMAQSQSPYSQDFFKNKNHQIKTISYSMSPNITGFPKFLLSFSI
jgi:hypothetical protein